MVNARSEFGGRNERASRLGVRLPSAAFSDDGATTSDQRDLIAKDAKNFKKQGLTRRRGDAEMRERVMGKEVSEARDQRAEGRGQRAEDGGPASLPLFPSVEKGSVQKTTDRVSPSIPNPEGIESFSEGLGRPTALPWYQTTPTTKPTLKGLDINKTPTGHDAIVRSDPTLSGLKNDFGAAFSRVGPEPGPPSLKLWRTGQPFAKLSNPVGIRKMDDPPFPNHSVGIRQTGDPVMDSVGIREMGDPLPAHIPEPINPPSLPNPEGIESFSEGLGRPTALPWYQTIPTLKPTLKGLDIPLLPNPEGIESFSEGLARPRAYPGKPTPTTQSPTLKGLDIPLSLCLNRSPRSLSIPYSRPRTAAHSCEIAPCAKNSIVTSGAFSPTMNAKPSPLAEQKTMFIYSPVSPGFVTRPPSSKNSNAGLRFGSKQRDRAWTILPGKADTGFSRSVFRRSLASETTFSARKNTIARSPSKRNICDSLNDTRWRLMNGIFGIDPTLSGLNNDFRAAFSRVGPEPGQPFAKLSNPVGIPKMDDPPFPNHSVGMRQSDVPVMNFVGIRQMGNPPLPNNPEGIRQTGDPVMDSVGIREMGADLPSSFPLVPGVQKINSHPSTPTKPEVYTPFLLPFYPTIQRYFTPPNTKKHP